ncbi:unnamed protein product [Closterium sp. NIES-54]
MRPLRDEGGRRRDVLLVLDSYRGHLIDHVGQTMRLIRLTRAMIPVGCTLLVQPQDVSINRAFEVGVRHHYSTWFEEEGIGYTTPADVPEEMVRTAFLTCAISNAEDGREDHMILAHLRDKAEVEVLEDVMEELDEMVPSPFYSDPAVAPTDATVESEAEAVLAADADEADEEVVPPNSDSSESDDDSAGNADEWSDEG